MIEDLLLLRCVSYLLQGISENRQRTDDVHRNGGISDFNVLLTVDRQ